MESIFLSSHKARSLLEEVRGGVLLVLLEQRSLGSRYAVRLRAVANALSSWPVQILTRIAFL